MDLTELSDFARRTVGRALSRLPARAFDPTDAVYVVMDPRGSPARELAIQVITEDERIAETDARKLLDARIEAAESVRIPFVLAVVVSRDALRASATGLALPAAVVAEWLAEHLRKSHCRVLVLAGMRARFLDLTRVTVNARHRPS